MAALAGLSISRLLASRSLQKQGQGLEHTCLRLASGRRSSFGGEFLVARFSSSRKAELRGRKVFRVRAEEDSAQKLAGTAIKAGNQALDAAANLLPDSIPKPVAKAGVGLLAFTIAISLVQAIFNSFVTLIFLGGLGYGAFVYFSKGEPKGSANSSDALDEARKIMDKYK